MKHWLAVLGLLIFSMNSAAAAETAVIDAATSTTPTCSTYVPKANNYSMQMSAGQSTTITKIFIRLSSTAASDQIYIRSIDANGSAGTLLATFAYSSEVNAGSYYESVFTGTLNVSAGTKYWINYSGTVGNICHDTTSPTYTNSFALVTSASLYQWAYGTNPFTEANHWNMRIYANTIAPDTTPPTYLVGNLYSIPENETAVATIRVSESSTITISSGVDQGKFRISQTDSTTANLSFISAPNFEVPTDSGADNTYQVGIRASDAAGNSAYMSLTATVTNVDENARVTSYTIASAPVKAAQVNIVATVNFAGKVTFLGNKKRIPGCINIPTVGSGPITATCSWKPATRGSVGLTFSVVPTAANNFSTTTTPAFVSVGSRSNNR